MFFGSLADKFDLDRFGLFQLTVAYPYQETGPHWRNAFGYEADSMGSNRGVHI